jgi:hypothetical protein
VRAERLVGTKSFARAVVTGLSESANGVEEFWLTARMMKKLRVLKVGVQ